MEIIFAEFWLTSLMFFKAYILGVCG